jgi:hypothetical protein
MYAEMHDHYVNKRTQVFTRNLDLDMLCDLMYLSVALGNETSKGKGTFGFCLL